jgi:hypothetical protein
MRVCDRCFHRDGSTTPAVDIVIFQAEDTRLDVCQGCKEELNDFIQLPDKFQHKVGRKKKED